MPSLATTLSNAISPKAVKLIDKLHGTSTRFRDWGTGVTTSTSSNASSAIVDRKETEKLDDRRAKDENCSNDDIFIFRACDIWPAFSSIIYNSVKALSPAFLIPVLILHIISAFNESQHLAAIGLALFGVYVGILSFIVIALLPYLFIVYLLNKHKQS